MASHQLAIAKASLSAALLRPDPTSVNKQELSGFLTLLDEAVLKCSPANVQSCKRWLLKNVILSNARLTALGKYFVALSGSWKSGGSSISTPLTPSNKRRRLHVLYILFDTLYHLRHFSDRDVSASYATKRDVLQRALTELFALAASFESCPKHHQKLQTLLDIWEQKALDDAEHIQSYRNVVEEPTKIKSILDSLDASSASQNGSGSTNGAEILWDMPRSHGDSSTPWYDLPAANMMHLIDSERPGPIHPRDMKPLKFNPGPADPELVEAVKDFLQDVDRMYQSQPPEDEGIVIDIDPMGQSIVKDLVSGERRESESYYGWSTEFCEKMKRKKRGLPISTDRGRGRSKDRFSNPDRSSDIIRKRRRSFSSESRSRGRYSSSSRSRSRQRYQRKDSRRRQYSSSSKSPSPLRDGRSSPGYYRDRRDSRSASPPPRHHDSHNFSPSTVALPSTGSGVPSGNNFVPPPFPFLSQQGSPPPPFPPPFSTAGSSGFPPPPPPPPPPNYSGPWPPPPPPPNFAYPQRQMSQMQGVPQFGYPTPPPPPPPPPQQYGGSTDASMDPRLQRKGNGSAGYR